MRTRRTADRLMALLIVVVIGAGQGRTSNLPSAEGSATAPASRPSTPPTPPTQAEIRGAILHLNHPLPARRQEAIRQLAAWGPVAFAELREAAGSRENLEAALLARNLLAELEAAILIGAQVRLEVQPAHARWDEPVALTVEAHNPTPGVIRVPWPEPRPVTASHPVNENASQVAAMLDAADFLTVAGPNHQNIDLRIEPIDHDHEVYQAVDVRAKGDPPSHLVGPGQTARLHVRLFNRGWARYPMLAAGTYTIRFAYQPLWKDESWTREKFGLVQTDPVTIEVTQAAPQAIREANRPMTLRLTRSGDLLVVDLHSTWDTRQWLNLNMGSELDVQGRLEWRVRPDGRSDAEPLVLGPRASPPTWKPEKLQQIDPGQVLTIAREPVASIREQIRSAGTISAQDLEISVRYVSVATPEHLRESLPAGVDQRPVPPHVFCGSVSSEPVKLGAQSQPAAPAQP